MNENTTNQSRRAEIEERRVDGDPLAPFRRPDGTIDIDALELGHAAPAESRLEGPAPFTRVRDGRREVSPIVRDARRRSAELAAMYPPPVPGIDRARLLAAVEPRS